MSNFSGRKINFLIIVERPRLLVWLVGGIVALAWLQGHGTEHQLISRWQPWLTDKKIYLDLNTLFWSKSTFYAKFIIMSPNAMTSICQQNSLIKVQFSLNTYMCLRLEEKYDQDPSSYQIRSRSTILSQNSTAQIYKLNIHIEVSFSLLYNTFVLV